MTGDSLRSAVRDVLQQGRVFLESVGEITYARTQDGIFGGSLGAHYRHVLDHFLCLVVGIRTGEVNYDERARNSLLERSAAEARLVTDGLLNEFDLMTGEMLRQNCSVTYRVGYGTGNAGTVKSNIARELMFCVGHAIHHYAILKLLCAGTGVRLPYEFGIAPSTLKHLENEASAS